MSQPQPNRVLVTMGPTHEPIDRVRFIGNRSSGRMGQAIALAAARRGLAVTALVGPVDSTAVPVHSNVRVRRFQTTAELETLMQQEWPGHDVLVMAAAVADFRPDSGPLESKRRRAAAGLDLHLGPTPDLLAAAAAGRRPDQFVIGFALEPEDNLAATAIEKIRRKNLDAIVANPLETMDSPTIRGRLITARGESFGPPTGPECSKSEFAEWLVADFVLRPQCLRPA